MEFQREPAAFQLEARPAQRGMASLDAFCFISRVEKVGTRALHLL